VSVLHSLKRAFTWFSIEVALLSIGYCVLVVWSGAFVTGILLGDVLLFAFLTVLFILDYAITSRSESENQEEDTQISPAAAQTKKEQALKYLKVIGNLTSGQLASLLEIDVRNLSKFINPLIQTGIIEAKKQGKTFIYSLKDAHSFLHIHNRHNSLEETDYVGHIALPKSDVRLPAEGNMLGRVALDDWTLGEFFYLPLKKYAQKGILVSGSSGSGKTVAAKVIVEELLDQNIPVIVFDATQQWERLKEKNENDEMLKRYRLFGMKQSPRGYRLQTTKQMIGVDEILEYKGATVFDLSGIPDETERVEGVALALDKVLEYFDLQKDSDTLRLLIVVEEAHLWTLREVGKDAVKFLDKAVRMLRKKGVGVMLVSHKMSDFDPTMRSSMNVSILFGTKYSGDLDGISKILGSEFSKVAPALPVSYSIFHLADLGGSFIHAWRPTYSQP
jgi:DNA-binding transcriptional ArsR family regulator/KaiC/GvpD/RAD55 family RecA-like ATPase